MAKIPKKIRVVLVGGGTAGHIYPLIAVSRALRRSISGFGAASDIRFFGDPGIWSDELEAANIRISRIPASKWRRYFDVQNFFDIFKFFFGLKMSLLKMYFFMPHLCFSKGGPGALAPLSAARFYAVPIVIHESDAIPGITNRITGRFARRIELAFTPAGSYFPRGAINVVGNPVREEFLGAGEPRAARAEFDFNDGIPVLLFLGGSQGAEALNEFVLKNIRALTENFQILHQVGFRNFDEYRNRYLFLTKGHDDRLKERYRFFPYFGKNMRSAYDAADLVVARAGAGTIFELAALKKPSILVPLPESANNHQVENAYTYARTGATIVLEEENFLPSILFGAVQKILRDEKSRAAMGEAAGKFYIPDAAEKISEDILSVLLPRRPLEKETAFP